MITTKILGAISALFASTSVLFLTLWLISSSSLELLKQEHKSLQLVSEECAKAKITLDKSYQSSLKIIKSQRESLDKVKGEEKVVVENISTYKPKCPVVNTEIGKTNEVDIDAPLDPEFIRVSESSN